MNLGDIVWAELPDRGGREQRGRRPALFWQDTTPYPLPTVLVIPLSTRPDAARFRCVHPVEPSLENGLAERSLALVFHLGAVDARRLGNTLGVLSGTDLQAITTLAKRLQGLR